jgi:hypothetical protein
MPMYEERTVLWGTYVQDIEDLFNVLRYRAVPDNQGSQN